MGSLEVRTLQEAGGEEAVGAVFSAEERGRSEAGGGRSPLESHRLAKVTEYVEGATGVGAAAAGGRRRPRCRYYVVLETEQGAKVVTERLPDGTTSWEENPVDLADRKSLAKALRTSGCGQQGLPLGQAKT